MQRGSGSQPIHHTYITHTPLHLDHLNTQEMCDSDTSVRINPVAFFLISDRFKTQEMCIKGVEMVLIKGVGSKYWIMMMTIEMMTRLLSGTMVIKNTRLRKQK